MLQLQSNSQGNQGNKPAKKSKLNFLLPLVMFLLIEFPKISLSWITLAEKMPLLQSQWTQAVEKVLKSSTK